MNDSDSERPTFTPQQLHDLELQQPAFKRSAKLKERRRVRTSLKDPSQAGGIKSSLDPINPQNLEEFGEPTIPLKKEDISRPGKN